MKNVLKSCLFEIDGLTKPNLIDRKLITYFAYYTCKQKRVQSNQRKALFIAQESSVDGFMRSDLFEEVVRKICELASIRLLRTVVQVGYSDD